MVFLYAMASLPHGRSSVVFRYRKYGRAVGILLWPCFAFYGYAMSFTYHLVSFDERYDTRSYTPAIGVFTHR
jgi:hypothetical protein